MQLKIFFQFQRKLLKIEIGFKRKILAKLQTIWTESKIIFKTNTKWFRIFTCSTMTKSILYLMKKMLNWSWSKRDQRWFENEVGLNQQIVSKIDSCKISWYNWIEEKKGRLWKGTSWYRGWYQKVKQIIRVCWLIVSFDSYFINYFGYR